MKNKSRIIRGIIYCCLIIVFFTYMIFMIICDKYEVKKYEKIDNFKINAIKDKNISIILPVKLLSIKHKSNFKSLIYLTTQYGAISVTSNKNFQNIVLVFFKKTKNHTRFVRLYFQITDPKIEKKLLEYIKLYGYQKSQ